MQGRASLAQNGVPDAHWMIEIKGHSLIGQVPTGAAGQVQPSIDKALIR